jgi:type IV pilus assembly protein PilB
MKDRIGEMLLRAGIIDEEKLESAFDYQRNQGGKVYGALVKLDYLDEDDLVEFLSRQQVFQPCLWMKLTWTPAR